MPRVHIDKVVENVYVLRVDDDETKYFEALWYIPEGITYNSYVLTTRNGAVVFDSWKSKYADLFIESLKSVIDLRDIKHVVVHHTEPDHSGSIPKLLELTDKKPVLIGHPLAKALFTSFYNVEAEFRTVRDQEELLLGGKKLRFIHVPWLHWPDTMATYIEEEGVLLTCDAFGGYGVMPVLYDEETIVQQYLPYVRKYVVTVIGHYREHIVKNIEKIAGLKLSIKVIAPAHGLIWRNNPQTIINYYYKLGLASSIERKILVIYDSMYGFVERAINVVLSELKSRGFDVKTYAFTDNRQASIGDILSDAVDSVGIVIGASTYDGKLFPTMSTILKILIEKLNAEKPLLIINVSGWGKPIDESLKTLYESSKFKVVDLVGIKGLIQDNDIDRLKRSIDSLIKTLQ